MLQRIRFLFDKDLSSVKAKALKERDVGVSMIFKNNFTVPQVRAGT